MTAVFREDREAELTGDYLPPTGTFVEVGAFEPVSLSQTWHLEQRGWNGLLIEPVPQHAERLRAARRAKVVELACCAPENHGATMPLFLFGGRSSLHFEHGPPISVRTATLDSVLSDHGISTIDFLSVDVEGSEVEVFRGFSFEKYRPQLILVEDFADDFTRHRYLKARGYKRVRRTGNNSWYIPKERRFPISPFGRFQLVRKYYLSYPMRKLKSYLRSLRDRNSNRRHNQPHHPAAFRNDHARCRWAAGRCGYRGL